MTAALARKSAAAACLPAAAVGAAGEGEGRSSRRGKVYAGAGGVVGPGAAGTQNVRDKVIEI